MAGDGRVRLRKHHFSGVLAWWPGSAGISSVVANNMAICRPTFGGGISHHQMWVHYMALRAAFHRHFTHRPQIGPLTRGTRQYTLPHQINREVNIITFLVILALNLGNYPRIWPSTILIYG